MSGGAIAIGAALAGPAQFEAPSARPAAAPDLAFTRGAATTAGSGEGALTHPDAFATGGPTDLNPAGRPVRSASDGGGSSGAGVMLVPSRPAVDWGAQNELRSRRRLWADRAALAAVREFGLSDQTIRHFRLGLNEPAATRSGLLTRRALAVPLSLADGSRSGRWGFMALAGVTEDAPQAEAWTAGGARVFYSGCVTAGATLVIVRSPVDAMLLWQTLCQDRADLVVISSSMPGTAPSEWRDPRFWRGWSQVVLGLGPSPQEEEVARVVGRAADRELLRCVPPEAWADLVRTGASSAEIQSLLGSAAPWRPAEPPSTPEDGRVFGDFQAAPVSVDGALVGGMLHYPLAMERRAVEERGGVQVIVQHYVTRVLRSDGALLDVERLPAPIGTPPGSRVLALSDGTRIRSEPKPGRFSTWSYGSIAAFRAARADAREPSRRPLARILADVEAHLRSASWLPHDDDFALAALFVVATFVHRAFAAFPIMLVNGPRGSGKSEFGNAMAAVCANAVVAGRITAAGLVRLLAESRGTVVLDDLEGIANPRNSAEDVPQVLKVSYKASTATRVTPGRDGRAEVLDFFGPKIITNIGSADPVLLSRMLVVRTSHLPPDGELGAGGVDACALRDEMHVWAMCEIGAVQEAYAPLASGVRCRRSEIAAALRAMAVIAGGAWSERLERALAAEAPPAPERIETSVARAVRRLVVEDGALEIAMPRLALEIAATAAGPIEMPAAETLGRMLIAIGARERDSRVDRRRLHGEVTRVYALSQAYVDGLGRPADAPPDAFAFCAGPCASCRYDTVCDGAAPWLRPAKLRRGPAA